MSAWKGIVGRSFTAAAFAEYVGELSFPDWAPSFVVVHNTYSPTLANWHDVPGASRMRGLENYYRDIQKWSAGPHLFVAADFIWAFTPLITPGVHSPSWNANSWGVETTGDWDTETPPPALMENLVSALAALHEAAGIDPATLRFHREDPLTTHKHCPGANLDKADLIGRIQTRLSPLVT